jgi:Rps23 Pro-64 3,4-dihydroxylase Tpa1-like proline 4-hydroxylase
MINPDVLHKASAIQSQFQNALPFRHVEIRGFLDESACEQLLADFPPFDEKNALNEHGRVGNKAVVEKVRSISPFYADFHRFIGSKEFLDAMSRLTGIRDLIADETLYGGGTHENREGQYLDAHVDFNIDERRILHRRLNVLIYLNKEWEPSWGGNIELHSNPRRPESDKVVSFPPLFNHAVIFETNEYSWHGFQTITLPEQKKHLSRKSFSIYLYTKDRPANEVVAPHTTLYVCRPLPAHIKPGMPLVEEDYRVIQSLMANRDGLIEMYQHLLIAKEEGLRRLMELHHGMLDHHFLASRSLKLYLAVQGLRRRLRKWLVWPNQFLSRNSDLGGDRPPLQ